MSYRIGVRALCEFTAKAGDLDLRFTPSPSSQQGIAGHRVVTSRRGAGYEAEVALSGNYKALTVRGRADGFDAATRRLEEIKTYRGPLDAIRDRHRRLHRAQANVYAALLCAQLDLPGATVAVVYFNVDTQEETALAEYMPAAELRRFFEHQCDLFLEWAASELTHRTARDHALTGLAFPYSGFRIGQRQLAESVYKAVCTAQPLMAQAPTGIGKTLATLFPALKATAARQLDKLFFLAAKTPGRALALEALRALRAEDAALPLRVLELTAREKLCEHPDKSCHGESCPLAAGFYDRLPAARQAAALQYEWNRDELRILAAQHSVCPYYLAQELARWSDVVVADYNYFFDASALLFGLQQAGEWAVTVLVDEAHSLVERARAMYSAELDQDDLTSVRRSAPPPLKKALDRLQRTWRQLSAAQQKSYTVQMEPPPKLLEALRNAVAVIAEFQAENPDGMDASLLAFYFDALQFCRIAESFDEHSLCDTTYYLQRGKPRTKLALRNVVPGRFLQPRFAATRSAILFSATLGPWNFYQKMLGLPENTPWIDVESPFGAGQLAVHIAAIPTRFHQRGDSIAPIVDVIEHQFNTRPGNYLAFFSSFEYLEQVAALLRRRCPAICIWTQQRRMDEQARLDFIERFSDSSCGIGFAVLGGAFGEGIDLPGNRLIGAFVATLGLPQVNPVNEHMMQRIGAIFGPRYAYDYAYLIPGLRKVTQAAGRVIRTAEDQGTLFLIDERFQQARVQRLLPTWWQLPPHGSDRSLSSTTRTVTAM
jgi:DNA excision repair protein ERCC-2